MLGLRLSRLPGDHWLNTSGPRCSVRSVLLDKSPAFRGWGGKGGHRSQDKGRERDRLRFKDKYHGPQIETGGVRKDGSGDADNPYNKEII